MLTHSPGSTISTHLLALGDNDLPEIPDDVPDPTTLIVVRNATVLEYTADFTASIVSVDGAVFLLTVNLVTPAAANDNFLLQLAVTFDAMEKQWYQFVKISCDGPTGNITHINGVPIDVSDLAFYLINSKPVVGGVLELTPGNGYNVLGGNEIEFIYSTWTDLANVESVALSLVWHPDKSDRTVLINSFAGQIDAGNNRVFFELDETITSPLFDYRTLNPEDLCYDVDFEMKVAAGGKVQTRVHGPGKILDPVTNPNA